MVSYFVIKYITSLCINFLFLKNFDKCFYFVQGTKEESFNYYNQINKKSNKIKYFKNYSFFNFFERIKKIKRTIEKKKKESKSVLKLNEKPGSRQVYGKK